ncbi:MAG TPA: TIGR02301 family protein [Microvirga sp.]|nr:TIGR02301 family protein [Microvirga sp.]
MTRGAAPAAAALVLAAAPAHAQSFFERLFRPLPQYAPPQYAPPQYRPQPRRAPAQQRPSQAAPPAAQPQQQPAAAEPPPAPYEPELLRMAEIIGSVAFLRSLCTAPDAAEWPQRMQQLIDAEGTTPGRRERLAGAYNRGYRAFALTYRVCTPSATEATNRYLDEGDKLARNLSSRYGG